MKPSTVVAVDRISKSYGNFRAVHDLSFEIFAGEIFALLGPNGSGKTTTIRMVLDILKPDTGNIRVLGGPLTEATKDRIGYLPEERGLYRSVPVLEVMVYLGRLKGMTAADYYDVLRAREAVIGLVAEADRERISALGKFAALDVNSADGVPLFIARTGYTGEDGFEIVLSEDGAVAFWNALVEAGVKPAGLAARDTLRLEAGMNLYGQDMDEEVTPYVSGLGWTVSLDEGREFIGRQALEQQKAEGVPGQIVGLVMDERGVLRHGQRVLSDAGEGRILSGTFSPTIGKAIALARIPAGDPGQVRVDMRGREVPLRLVRYPFVREGQVQQGVAD